MFVNIRIYIRHKINAKFTYELNFKMIKILFCVIHRSLINRNQ